MLGKLFKYEFKNTAKVMLTIYAMLIVTTLLGVISLHSSIRLEDAGEENSIVGLFLVSAVVLYILAVFVFLIVTYVYMCTHFYKTMYSAQGYLTHTLPVKQLTTFHVKLAVSFVWLLAAFLLFFGSIFALIIGASDGELLSAELWGEVYRELESMGMDTVVFAAWIIVTIMLSCLTYLLWVFASASIGQLFSSNKVLASVVAGILLYIVNQVLGVVVSMITYLIDPASAGYGIFRSVSVIGSANMVLEMNHYYLAVQTAYSLLVVAALYAICNVIVRKHINLE